MIGKLLGHTQVQTTARYAHLAADPVKAATEALRLTARDLQKLGVIDAIVPEPLGGAHRLPEAAIDAVGDAVATALAGIRRSRCARPALRVLLDQDRQIEAIEAGVKAAEAGDVVSHAARGRT